MQIEIPKLKGQLKTVLDDLQAVAELSSGKILVIGCSTSEVIGERIGTSGTEEVAAALYEVFSDFKEKTGVQLAFQCCEHLNRALVVEQETALAKGLEPVSVIPVRKAGGAMATYAFQHIKNPIVVEFIKANAGIDIGDTLIGMHLKHVAVPVRSQIKQIGQAHVTLATTRPKLIGGERAVYSDNELGKKCSG
ncbi:TIGR01440 family protein [Calidifontibacillus oryziterrae]|uniref:TIGR01440 family protein n=1 Tax=Calidifontibacillus oryziterrae TaxID=1191699 RepID=UPI000312EA1A|nr:TIGR01440 family protein [Calidifontibacillus oryziterrae]